MDTKWIDVRKYIGTTYDQVVAMLDNGQIDLAYLLCIHVLPAKHVSIVAKYAILNLPPVDADRFIILALNDVKSMVYDLCRMNSTYGVLTIMSLYKGPMCCDSSYFDDLLEIAGYMDNVELMRFFSGPQCRGSCTLTSITDPKLAYQLKLFAYRRTKVTKHQSPHAREYMLSITQPFDRWFNITARMTVEDVWEMYEIGHICRPSLLVKTIDMLRRSGYDGYMKILIILSREDPAVFNGMKFSRDDARHIHGIMSSYTRDCLKKLCWVGWIHEMWSDDMSIVAQGLQRYVLHPLNVYAAPFEDVKIVTTFFDEGSSQKK